MKKRLISALIILLLVVPIIIKGGTIFNISLLIVGIFSMKELLDAVSKKNNLPIVIKLISMIAFGLFQVINFKNIEKGYIINYSSIAIILLSLLLPLIFYNDSEKYGLTDSFYASSIVILMSIGFGSIAMLRESNINLFIFILLIPILTDTFAYFGGMFIGKHYLCHKISPKKTWEGFFTGLVLTTISLSMIYLSIFHYAYSPVVSILVIMFLSIISSLGDLFFSYLKRTLEIKDFSNLIPGHGGLIDRLDSIMFVYIAYSIIMGLI